MSGKRRIRFLEIIDGLSQIPNQEHDSVIDNNKKERRRDIEPKDMLHRLKKAQLLRSDGGLNIPAFEHRMKQILVGKKEHFTRFGWDETDHRNV